MNKWGDPILTQKRGGVKTNNGPDGPLFCLKNLTLCYIICKIGDVDGVICGVSH